MLCFDFLGDLNAAGGGTLDPIDGLGSFSEGVSICKLDSIYTWDISTGLVLQDPVNYFPQDNYTIELLFKFTTQPYPSFWKKIIDFKNRTSDRGLYLYGDNLQMYGQYTGVSNIAQPNVWFRLFLTRDGTTDSIKGYINNSLEIELEDTDGSGIFTNALILFKDDIVVSGEESAGVIDYVRVYDYPLSAIEIDLIVESIPVVRILGNSPVCPGDSLVLQASGADNYVWSTGDSSQTITVYPSTLDTISLTGYLNVGCGNSCPGSPDTVLLSVNDMTTVTLGADTQICSEEHLLLNASNSYISYTWSDNSEEQILSISQEGEYWVSVLDSNNCLSSDTMALFKYDVTTVKLEADTQICAGEHLLLNASKCYNSYTWSDNSVEQTLLINQEGEYWVSVLDSNKCLSSDTINILAASSGCEFDIFIPNVFSPNGDGLNDYFKISGDRPNHMNLLIFNRWGNIVFKTTDKDEYWDGKYKGVKVSSGVYYYMLSVDFHTDTPIKKKGNISVLY